MLFFIANYSGNTKFTFSYTSTDHISNWDPMAKPFEKNVFLADISHIEANVNRSWRARIGRGGGIVSYIGPSGETVPPQKHDNAPWIDEVWQLVSVEQKLNEPENPFFIHEAGTYTKDSPATDTPFYSPNLAKYCSGKRYVTITSRFGLLLLLLLLLLIYGSLKLLYYILLILVLLCCYYYYMILSELVHIFNLI
jgi:hypothetical protein